MKKVNVHSQSRYWSLVDDLDQFDLGDSDAQVSEWHNFKALNLNKNGVATFLKSDIKLEAFRLQAYVAIPEAPGFIGLVFGARDSSNYELIYLSPGNNDGNGEIQYDPVMNGSTTWQIYNGPNYLVNAPYIVGEWIKFTLEVHQKIAKVYVGDTETPQMIISSLQHGTVEGKIGFWGYLPVYIRDLSIEDLSDQSFDEYENNPIISKGFITDWLVSDPYFEDSRISNLNWTKTVTEENGTLNLNRLYASVKDSIVQAKSSVSVVEETQSTISFGFSDHLRLWINDQEIYNGSWLWSPPESDGRIRPEHITIQVKWNAGTNSIRAEITSRETVFGWGFCLKTGI
ncbi:hypothetical protein [Paenibacillus nasutitermitis]|uniref:Uncharacterized protein n=1 Tax=Paenibacillus nasutitermitis TaxID=1652958 RepID=A0A916YUS2_9BACL|nr:hypothetical protein [Paenibacillus nasutitermitis]GGD62694.1 hypothetical protein GCM10010911_20610 [Paenibacillus nasutitermitis]